MREITDGTGYGN